jgi:hypothetical protein
MAILCSEYTVCWNSLFASLAPDRVLENKIATTF